MNEIIEEDKTIETMEHAWARLPEERWKEIKKHLEEDELQGNLRKEELEIAKQLARSPAVAIRALAFARSYKKLNDKKKEQKGSLPGSGQVGKAQFEEAI